MVADNRPVCHVVAGPNGSGKSTFALRYLPDFAGAVEYVNPDLMAQGMSPTDIRLSAIKAGSLSVVHTCTAVDSIKTITCHQYGFKNRKSLSIYSIIAH